MNEAFAIQGYSTTNQLLCVVDGADIYQAAAAATAAARSIMDRMAAPETAPAGEEDAHD